MPADTHLRLISTFPRSIDPIPRSTGSNRTSTDPCTPRPAHEPSTIPPPPRPTPSGAEHRRSDLLGYRRDQVEIDSRAPRDGRRARDPERGRDAQAGPDLQDRAGAARQRDGPPRRGRARDPARGLRFPSQPRLELPLRSRRHLRQPQPDQALRPAYRRHGAGAGAAAEGGRTVPGAAQGRGRQLRGPREGQAQDRCSTTCARCIPTSGSSSSAPTATCRCGSWTCSRRSGRVSAA